MMKTKAKKLSHRLLALFMAIVMGITCFSGVLSAQAASNDPADNAVDYNNLAWPILSDEQVATEILDFVDSLLPALKALEPQLADMVNHLEGLPSVLGLKWEIGNRRIHISGKLGSWNVINKYVTVKLGSIDEIYETLTSVQNLIDDGLVGALTTLGVDLGIITDLQFGAVKTLRRANGTKSCDMLRGLLAVIRDNADTVVGNLLRGELTLGAIPVDVYKIIGGLIGMSSDTSTWKSDAVYNIVKQLLFDKTEWFSQDEIDGYTANPSTFVYDDVLLEKMTAELLDKINVLVTYPNVVQKIDLDKESATYGQLLFNQDGSPTMVQDTSAMRRFRINAEMALGKTYAQACTTLGYDSNLIYTSETDKEGNIINEGNILLFAYGNSRIELTATDSLFDFGQKALPFAWNTVLRDTLGLVHVNYSVERGHGTNFDNAYFYWARDNYNDWDATNPETMYSATRVEAWADAVWDDYNEKDSEGNTIPEKQYFHNGTEFLNYVKNNFEHDRDIKTGAGHDGSWKDIESNTIVNKARYSPLCDYAFGMETGPINLYFMQLGAPNVTAFLNAYPNKIGGGSYPTLVSALNDCLLAACKDLFPQSANIRGSLDFDTLQNVNPARPVGSTGIKDITEALTGNALKIVQYAADAMDANILRKFYDNGGTALTEANLEQAMMPLLISMVSQINFNNLDLREFIHPEDFDRCQDAEALVFVLLREYLSYVLPNNNYNQLVNIAADSITVNSVVDQDDDGDNDMFDVVLLMARDAVSYVMQGYVPVSSDTGAFWDVYADNMNSTTSIFDILNSVVCYYCNDYNNQKTSGRAMGLASLLGVCDASGNSKVNLSKTLWQNFDAIINDLLPVLGELQGKGHGNFDSKSLIWGDIVCGMLNISDTHTNAGGTMGGVSNFVFRFLSVISAEPIQTKHIVDTVYDFLKDALNGVFGPRYSDQEWVPVPDRADNEHPFDDVVHAGVLNVMAWHALNNFAEFGGVGGGHPSTINYANHSDSIIRGIMFAVTALNSFTGWFPTIGEHRLQMPSATFADSVAAGYSSGASVSSQLIIHNNSAGVNFGYVENNQAKAASRYYIKVKSASIPGNTVANPDNTLVAPGEDLKLNTTITFNPDAGKKGKLYVATVTYDICDKSGNVKQSNLTTTGYQYITTDADWESTVFDTTGLVDGHYPLKWTSHSDNQTHDVGGVTTKTSELFGRTDGNNRLLMNYPGEFVVDMSKLENLSKYGMWIHNHKINNKVITNKISIDGVYYYDTNTVYNDDSNGNVTLTSANAKVVCDAAGNLVKKGLYDVYVEGVGWNNNGGAGYDDDGVASYLGTITDVEARNAAIKRDHIVYTLAEAKSHNMVYAYHFNDRGICEYVYIKPGDNGYKYDTQLAKLTMQAPIDGLYLNTYKIENIGSESPGTYYSIAEYDGVTQLNPGETKTANLCFYNGTKPAHATMDFAVIDTSSKSDLEQKYDQLRQFMTNYKATDFVAAEVLDEDDTRPARPETMNLITDAIEFALKATGTQVNVANANVIGDKTQRAFVTGEDGDPYGDQARVPYSTANDSTMPTDVKNAAYLKNGYYYYDKECVAPIYTRTALTAAGVTNGKDAAGMSVVLNPADGKYYHANTPIYETQWDWLESSKHHSAPWRELTETQATWDDGIPKFAQEQFFYLDANGNQCTSKENWVCMVAESSYQLIPVTATKDNRGVYSQAIDYLDYAIDYASDTLKEGLANELLTYMSKGRHGMNVNNFEVVTYKKMVDIAKSAEGLYTIDLVYNETSKDINGSVKVETGKKASGVKFDDYYRKYADNENITITKENVKSLLSSTQVEGWKQLYDFYLEKTIERGYTNIKKSLEDEIKCAAGSAYSAFTATPATYDEETWDKLTDASVATTAASVPFGAVENGQLVNNGPVIYADNLWTQYVDALANAVAIATEGNTTYTHKAAAPYVATRVENGEVVSNGDTYTCQVSDCYTADTKLQAAEIALETAKEITVVANGGTVTLDGKTIDETKPYAVPNNSWINLAPVADEGYEFVSFENVGTANNQVQVTGEDTYGIRVKDNAAVITANFQEVTTGGEDTYDVSGSIVIATDGDGSTRNFAVSGEYLITVLDGEGEVVATLPVECADGVSDFTINLANGSYTATIESEYAVTRENIFINVDGAEITDAAVPMVVCNFNKDAGVTGADALIVYSNLGNDEAPYCNINGDAGVTGADALVVYGLLGVTELPDTVIE